MGDEGLVGESSEEGVRMEGVTGVPTPGLNALALQTPVPSLLPAAPDAHLHLRTNTTPTSSYDLTPFHQDPTFPGASRKH